MDLLKRCILSFCALVSVGAMAAKDPQFSKATEFGAYVFENYRAQSGNISGALAVGGDLDIQGYSIASDAGIAIGEYGLLVEGDAKFKSGRLYRGKIRVQGDVKKIDSSVLWGLPDGVSLENQPLEYSIRNTKDHFIGISDLLVTLDVNGVVDYRSKQMTLIGDGEASLQVFHVNADDLKKQHTFKVQGIPAEATVIINVVNNNAKKLQIVNKNFSALIPHRHLTLFNFHNAQQVMLQGVAIEGSILAPSAEVQGKNGDINGMVIANAWDGQMNIAAKKFEGDWVQQAEPLSVDITSPDTLVTVGYSPIEVSGTLSGEVVELTVNGVPVTPNGQTFVTSVELTEGFNTVVARVTDEAGEQLTDSIVVSLDLTPPYLTLDSHEENQLVYSDKITVTGLVNDIVRGTVEDEQATVEVNGVTAEVANRSYAAKDVSLTEGENLLTVTAVDQAGNSSQITRTVIYKIPAARQLLLSGGQDQTGIIGANLAEPLKVQVVDQNSNPVAGESVVFRVIQGAGVLGESMETYGRAIVTTTDSEGFAQTPYKLGYRTGVANHKVRTQVVGYENEVIFYASAESMVGDKISINSGNNQRGAVGQTLPSPFIVAVTDAGANTVQGARVRFEVIRGEGVFQNGEAAFETITDSDGRATAQYTLGALAGLDMQRVRATLLDGPDGETLLASFMATAFEPADPGQTSVIGLVMNNQDQPIPGVTIRIEGTDRTAQTDRQGKFKLEQVPVGPVHLIADGSTALLVGEYPSLSYHLVTVAGVENPLSAPIYMVKLDTENAVYAGPEDVTLTLEDYPGFKLEIAKDSITFPDGAREGLVSVTSVNASKVPMAPPNGMQPQFIVTVQPVGATFDPPARLTLPNVDGHAPGAQVEMYSYDHDLEEFVSIGLGTVSEDGSVVGSNPGVGVVKAGWHCGSQPGGSGTAHNCPICQKCEGDSCVRDPGQDSRILPPEQQTPEDCKVKQCVGYRVDTSDKPTQDTPNDCKQPGCDGENPTLSMPDDDDISEDDAKCSSCSEGEKIKDPNKEGNACGDGTDAKACYTCKDGECGNHCEASPEKEVVSLSPPPAFEKVLYEALDVLGNSTPYFEVKAQVNFSLEEERGEKCCKDCSKGADPKPYTKSSIKGGGSLNVGFIVPGLGGIFRLPEKTYGPIVAGGKITFGPGANGKLSLTGTGSGEKSECEDTDCVEMEVKIGGSAAVGIFFKAEGEVKACNPFDEKDCQALLAGTAEADTSVNFGASAFAKTYAGETCSKEGCLDWKVEKVEFKAGVKYDITAFGIYKYEYSTEVKQAFSDGASGGGCS